MRAQLTTKLWNYSCPTNLLNPLCSLCSLWFLPSPLRADRSNPRTDRLDQQTDTNHPKTDTQRTQNGQLQPTPPAPNSRPPNDIAPSQPMPTVRAPRCVDTNPSKTAS